MRTSPLCFVLVSSLAIAACGGQAFEDQTPLPGASSTPGSTNDPPSDPAAPKRTPAAFCAVAERSSVDIELFQTITPSPPADYLALRRLNGGFDEPPEGRKLLTDAERGVRCASASDRAACERRYESMTLNALFYPYVFFTRGDDVGKIEDAAAALKLLGAIDSPEDAFFYARFSGLYAACAGEAKAAYRQIGDAYEIVTTRGGCGGPQEEVVVKVHRDGKVEDVSKRTIGPETGCQ